jgi:tripartite-type tricarboxylate transporter receptor subunit TctC
MAHLSLGFKLDRVLVAAALALGATSAAADAFPSKPIRIIVPSAPGGALDVTTRLVAQKMSETLGQSVIVDNRAGGDTLIGTRQAKDAAADGYTILAQANGFVTLPAVKRDPGYDPLKDFTPIGLMLRAPMVMYVGADQPDRTLSDFVARAKSHKLTYATGSVGGPTHVAAAMFLQAAGLNVTLIPYKGAGPAMTDVISGRVDMIFDGYMSSSGQLKSGRLRPLAVTSATRVGPLPGVPTFQEQGMDFNYSLWLGLVAKSGTPKEVIQRLSDALGYALNSKDLNARFQAEGSDPSFVTPEEFGRYLKNEMNQMAKVAGDLNLPKD